MTLRSIAVLVVIALEGAASAAPSEEDLFYQGKTAFDEGNYARAIAKWNESYSLSKEPGLLFNIAYALHRDGRCAEALAMYRRFITLDPASDRRTHADKSIRELTAECGAMPTRRRSDALEPSREPPFRDHDTIADGNETHSGGLQIVGLAAAGFGAVSVATGLYFGHRASSLREEVASACPGVNCDWGVLGSKDVEGRSAERRQYVFVGIGAAAIIGGGAMYWWASRAQRPAPIAIAPGRDGAVLTWSGSW